MKNLVLFFLLFVYACGQNTKSIYGEWKIVEANGAGYITHPVSDYFLFNENGKGYMIARITKPKDSVIILDSFGFSYSVDTLFMKHTNSFGSFQTKWDVQFIERVLNIRHKDPKCETYIPYKEGKCQTSYKLKKISDG